MLKKFSAVVPFTKWRASALLHRSAKVIANPAWCLPPSSVIRSPMYCFSCAESLVGARTLRSGNQPPNELVLELEDGGKMRSWKVGKSACARDVVSHEPPERAVRCVAACSKPPVPTFAAD